MARLNQSGFEPVAIIIAVVVVAVVGFVAWRVWDAKQQTQQAENQTTTNNTPSGSQSNGDSQTNNGNQSNQKVFKIPELGVEFDVKGDVTPLYNLTDASYGGIQYEQLRISTQELVNKGAALGSTNPCSFSSANWTNADFYLLPVRGYGSIADLLANEKNRDSNLTQADITPANGYYTVGTMTYYVPQGIESGTGTCLNDGSDFEAQQRAALRDSLAALRAAE